MGALRGTDALVGTRGGAVAIAELHPVPRTIRTFEYPLPAGAVVVLHSDGLSDRWTADTCAGVLSRAPLFTAMTLMRDAGTRRDDASVLVARVPDR